MRINRSTILVAIATLIAGVLMVFVWPTPYEHFTLYSDPPRSARVQRFTGRTELLGVNGWYNLADRRRAAARAVADTLRIFDSLTAHR